MKRMMAGQAAAALLHLLLAALVVAAGAQEALKETAVRSPSTLLSWNSKDPKAKRFMDKFSKVENCVADIDALYAAMRSPLPSLAKCASGGWLEVLSEGSLIGPKCCHAVRVAYWLSERFGRLLPPAPAFDEEPMYYVLFLCLRRYNYDKDRHSVPPPNHHP